jgi:hypothetical protein
MKFLQKTIKTKFSFFINNKRIIQNSMSQFTKITQLFLPFLFCGDEITDILYLIFNWDSFGNQNLKNSAIAFTLINGIFNFFCAIVVMGNMKSLRNAST